MICETKIYVFNYLTFEAFEPIQTYQNPKGIYALSPNLNATFLAFPDRSKGYVRIKSYDSPINTPLINAHDTPISCLALNIDGTLLATASEKGTVIRVFKVVEDTNIDMPRFITQTGSSLSSINLLIGSLAIIIFGTLLLMVPKIYKRGDDV